MHNYLYGTGHSDWHAAKPVKKYKQMPIKQNPYMFPVWSYDFGVVSHDSHMTLAKRLQ